MKTTLQLNKTELSQAVADFVAKKIGRTVKIDVSFDVTIDRHDYYDNPTGTHTITASASFDEERQP